MMVAVMGGVAWLVSLAACAWSVQWLCRREIREMKADHDIELAAMATRHKAEVLSMEEEHQKEMQQDWFRASELQEIVSELRSDILAYRMASEKYKAVADAVTRSISELNRAMALLVDADTLLKQAMQQDEGGDDDA